MRSLKPADEDIIIHTALKTELMVTLEDHLTTGGLYSIVAEVLLSRKLTATVLPLSLKEKWFKPGLLDHVLEYEGFTPEK